MSGVLGYLRDKLLFSNTPEHKAKQASTSVVLSSPIPNL